MSEGEGVELMCSVTVGQQYNTVSMLPVHADWDWERWEAETYYYKWPCLFFNTSITHLTSPH